MVASIVTFTVPGVLIGAQLGSIVATKLYQKALQPAMEIPFIIVALLIMGELII